MTYAALQASANQKTLALITSALFWLTTLYLAYEFFFVHLSYDDDFIYHQTPLRGQRRIPWDAVKEMRYSPGTQSLTLKTDGYGDVSVSPYADGSQSLAERVKAKVENKHQPEVEDRSQS